ncbi:MAG: type II toxin-antitoxin system death-on-curing family toxin [Polaromonas sp.]|nr:type II toxin-antitoxin system death-on-curing family toxin [Polaromonas sp.]
MRADLVYAVHEIQLARHGGLHGLRDRHAVESALARPEQPYAYGQSPPDAADLAAAYAHALARNHGFSDGNKRTAWVVARVFLADNDVPLLFSDEDAMQTTVAVAGGTVDEHPFAAWFRARMAEA